MRGRSVVDLLQLPVRLHGIQLGRLLDALVDPDDDRVIGFEILCGDDTKRFLPFSVAHVRTDEIGLDSALTLIDERDLEFYLRRSRRLSELPFAEPVVDDRGQIREARSAA